MSQPDDPSVGAEGPEQPAERGDELESETVSLLDADVEAPINAAVQNPDGDERQGTEGRIGMAKTKTPHHTKPKETTSKGTTPEEYRKLTREDLDKLAGEPLPERAAMSLINANVAAPVNAAIALNVLSDNSQAIAIAQQEADISQDN
jgi:hypothetical protein